MVTIGSIRLVLRLVRWLVKWLRERKPTDCKKIDDCPKIKKLLDKKLLAQQYLEKADEICAKCDEFERGTSSTFRGKGT